MEDKDVSLLFGWVVILGIIYAFWKTILFIYNIFFVSIPLQEINVITNSTMCDRVIEELKRRINDNSAIGFDCEWLPQLFKNENRNKVALIQLASSDGFCGLFRLNQMKTVPNSLKELLENESMYKVGVENIRDAMYLHEDYAINMRSALDLRHIAKICGYDPRGLASLSKSILDVELNKNMFITCSNWEAAELTDKQIRYAADDARVSVKIFDRLKFNLELKLGFTESNLENLFNNFKDKDFNITTRGRLYNQI